MGSALRQVVTIRTSAQREYGVFLTRRLDPGSDSRTRFRMVFTLLQVNHQNECINTLVVHIGTF